MDMDQMRTTHLTKIIMLVVLGLTTLAHQGYTSTGPDYFFTIQMASFKQEQSAVDAVDKLKQRNWEVFYRPTQIAEKGTWYRLYINRYATIQSAQAGINKLREKGIITDAYVRRLEGTTREHPQFNLQKPQPLAKAQAQLSATPPVESNKLHLSETMTSPEVMAAHNQRDPLRIRDIFVRLNDKKGDTAFIQADRYFWPVTHLSHDGGKTRLQVQIRNTGPFHKDISPQASGGRYIQNGQVGYDSDRDTLVLSLDLPSPAKYRVTQLYNQAENIFSLLVSE